MNEVSLLENSIGEVATFAGGCFWCTEAIFQRVKGVLNVRSGYTGGKIKNPSYREVCTGNTGHAEAVQVLFDPSEVSFEALLHVFFATHDPTTLDRQGNDIGTQYRSAIFYSNAEQKILAEKYIQELTGDKVFTNPIVTKLEPLEHFYTAENYHQSYFDQNREQPYCQWVINPKIQKLESKFEKLLKNPNTKN